MVLYLATFLSGQYSRSATDFQNIRSNTTYAFCVFPSDNYALNDTHIPKNSVQRKNLQLKLHKIINLDLQTVLLLLSYCLVAGLLAG